MNVDFVTTVGDCKHVEPHPPSRVNLMTYFEDLSPYEYSRHLPQGRGEVLNVGWLDDKMSYSHGAVDVDLAEKLLALCQWPVNQYFGWHNCPFCQECPVRIADLEGEFCLGDGEIRVPRNDGKVVYVAPNLIYHYVTAHQYLPPAEFLDSLRDLTLRNPALDRILEWIGPPRHRFFPSPHLSTFLKNIAQIKRAALPPEIRTMILEAANELEMAYKTLGQEAGPSAEKIVERLKSCLTGS